MLLISLKQYEELVIASKTTNKTGNFPWHFFYSSAKFHGLILAISIISTVIVYRYYLKKGFLNQIRDEVGTSLVTIKESFKNAQLNIHDWCKNVPPNKSIRYTLINEQGYVICDSSLEQENSDNHLNRAEVKMALTDKVGFSHRFSKTLRKEMIYGAVRVQWENKGKTYNGFLRKAVSVEKLQNSISVIDKSILLVVPILFIVIYLILLWSMINISKPINRLLNQISEMERNLPFNVKLKLLYKRDEWSHIYEALKQAEKNIQGQLNQINDENEKTSTLLESITDAIFAVDIHQNSLFYNNRFEKIFFKKNIIVTESIKLWRLFDNEQIIQSYHKSLKEGLTTTIKGHRFENIDAFFDISITPLRDREKNIIGAVGVFRDVTDTKLTEQMRVDFVANVSHEIRTPLTSIKGFAQILEAQKDKIDESLHQAITRIIFNSERLTSLFNDLLSLSVIESQNKLEFREVDLGKLVSAIKDSLSTIYLGKNIEITSDLQVSTITADKKLIEQALINLIDNACKYTYEKTQIKITSFVENDHIIISVSDEGPGISKEHLQRIFERFYRVENSRDRETGGTGLGLSIVKHIINKHKGSVWATSESGEGTIFFIKIPTDLSN